MSRLKRIVLYGLIAITAVAVSVGYGDLHSDNDAKKTVGTARPSVRVVGCVRAVHRLAPNRASLRARTGGTARRPSR